MQNDIFSTLKRTDIDDYIEDTYSYRHTKGLSKELIYHISHTKNEPIWMLDIRLKAYEYYIKSALPTWGTDLSKLDFDAIRYYNTATDGVINTSWDDVPERIKYTFERLKIPEAERTVLAGVGAQFESETVYHNLKEQYKALGVIFEDFDTAVKMYPELVKQYFMKCVSYKDHIFSALHYAVFSGGTFLYIPSDTVITEPLQAYFRMNAKAQGQFEHTLIVLENGAYGHYIEGCSAPKYGDMSSLHAGCVEIFVGKNASCRYSSVENWSSDTYNLNTKRALVDDNGSIEWVGGNLGSGATMLYPCSVLYGNNSVSKHLQVAFANTHQHHDTGAKIVCSGKNTRATVISKSISKDGGKSTYRGLVDIKPSADNAFVNIECDALMLDNESISTTIPHIQCKNSSAHITHEASAGRLSDDILIYLASRGIENGTAKSMLLHGFLDDITRALPLEYASELNTLIDLEMEGSVG